MVWCQTLGLKFQSKVNYVNLLSKERKSVIDVYRSQGTALFLRLIPRKWVEVDRNSLVEGGP